MKIDHITKRTSRSIAIISLLGASATGLTHMSYAFNSGPIGATNRKVCLFSVQLQKSVPIRREYLTKLAAATGESVASGNAVDDMYGNIKAASYQGGGTVGAGEAPEEGFSVWSLGTARKEATAAIDQFSLDCLSCHDGATASSVSVDLRNNPYFKGMRLKSFTSDHPIGMDYGRYVGVGEYKPVATNSTKMVFVDGKVGCLTCHDPLNSEKGHLVMSDNNSALCRTCHDK